MFKTTLNVLLMIVILSSCKDKKIPETERKIEKSQTTTPSMQKSSEEKHFFKLSLAQWSLHKAIISEEIDIYDFAKKANELGFEGIEYVSQLYKKELEKDPDPNKAMQQMLDKLKTKSEQFNVQNLIIMIDNEGDLAAIEESDRNQAVEKHKKWVNAAQFLGCHSIRVNLFGSNTPDQWVTVAADGLGKLATYAATKNINVIVENHGYLSSNASLLIEVIKKVNMNNCGTLPDFGNFCLAREGGKRWGAKCIDEYDKYKGVTQMMPYAKAVSAKSYDFDTNGSETTIDYKKMLDIVKNSGYNGFIGVEYEGDRLSEIEGITATKNLLTSISK